MQDIHTRIEKLLNCLVCCDYIYHICKRQSPNWRMMNIDERYEYTVTFLKERPEYLIICMHNQPERSKREDSQKV